MKDLKNSEDDDEMDIQEDVKRTFFAFISNFSFYTNISIIYYILNNFGTETDVNVYGMAYSWTMIVDAIIFGFSFAYRIVGGHAFGRGRFHFVGILFHRSSII
jgi:Na+-driven multidrug efflux pump